MNSEVLAYLTWRELLLAIVLVLVLYLFFRLWKRGWAFRSDKEEQDFETTQRFTHQQASGAYEAVRDLSPSNNMFREEAVPPMAEERHFWQPVRSGSSEVSESEALRQEFARLRTEIEQLKAEMRMLRESRHHDAAMPVGEAATQDVSPYYSDAVRMASDGKDAESISRLCGISRAEADLVVSMAKSNVR